MPEVLPQYTDLHGRSCPQHPGLSLYQVVEHIENPRRQAVLRILPIIPGDGQICLHELRNHGARSHLLELHWDRLQQLETVTVLFRNRVDSRVRLVFGDFEVTGGLAARAGCPAGGCVIRLWIGRRLVGPKCGVAGCVNVSHIPIVAPPDRLRRQPAPFAAAGRQPAAPRPASGTCRGARPAESEAAGLLVPSLRGAL